METGIFMDKFDIWAGLSIKSRGFMDEYRDLAGLSMKRDNLMDRIENLKARTVKCQRFAGKNV